MSVVKKIVPRTYSLKPSPGPFGIRGGLGLAQAVKRLALPGQDQASRQIEGVLKQAGFQDGIFNPRNVNLTAISPLINYRPGRPQVLSAIAGRIGRYEDVFLENDAERIKYFRETALKYAEKGWQSIRSLIESYDPQIAQKKEGTLAGVFHPLNRTFNQIFEQVLTGRINPLINLACFKYSPDEYPSGWIPDDSVIEKWIGFFPIAANPLNWGHILPPLMVQSALELDSVIIRVQGIIDYKELYECEKVGAPIRHQNVRESTKSLFPFFRPTDLGIERDNRWEGTQEMHHYLEMNQSEKLRLHYMLGAESEKRVRHYLDQQYDFLNEKTLLPNHNIIFTVIQRGRYGEIVTQEELEQMSREVAKTKQSKITLPIVIVKAPGIDPKISSSDYRESQDGAIVPERVHQDAQKFGWYGHPPIGPDGKPIADSADAYFRMRLAPVARKMAARIKEVRQSGVPGDMVLVSLDGTSGSGKTTLCQEVAKYLLEDNVESLVIPFDYALKLRAWRIALQKLVSGFPYTPAEEELIGDLKSKIIPGEIYTGEESFFDNDKILEIIRKVVWFRNSPLDSLSFIIPGAYIRQDRTIRDEKKELGKGQVVIFDGKYANSELFQEFFDLRYRLLDAAKRTSVRFGLRSRGLNPQDADVQIKFFELALDPSYAVYDRRTRSAINGGLINLQGEEWFMEEIPD